MSANSENRAALSRLDEEPLDEQVSYYRKPFMVLWAAVQESSLEVEEDFGLSGDLAQLWVAERLRQVCDSLVDRLAEKALAHGASKSNIARAAGADPTNADRRFPRLAIHGAKGRLPLDDVLDSLD
ncbi:hypothetical protein [Bifidobacterium cuniculi]|uniref:Uncharacterized protein n=1 Tax=Bifidobacterium cuniculi TaxID=1688 RepID=A0A087AVW8_9BIFI|nr:hypothetical protein [Bifidobacterium cuniculi]KFI62918.1 hypothetical protein BCUN_0749 [Bifidobacterium cuniculi]